MIVDEGVIVEIVVPGTGIPVEDGQIGEVVVTTFSHETPLIRFATGDLSAILPGTSPCGRTNKRIVGCAYLGKPPCLKRQTKRTLRTDFPVKLHTVDMCLCLLDRRNHQSCRKCANF